MKRQWLDPIPIFRRAPKDGSAPKRRLRVKRKTAIMLGLGAIAAGVGLWLATTGRTSKETPWSPEVTVIDLINDKRASVGVPRLRVTDFLTNYAEMRSQVMRRNGRMLPHDQCQYCGEVLGITSTGPWSVFNAWMHSPAHRHILLLRDINEIGCGQVNDNGRHWWACEVKY